jgi:hypothetical protein
MQNTTASPIRGAPTPVSTGGRHDERSGGALGDVKEIGTELAGAVRDSATSLFEEQRNRAADEIAALGEALRQSARGLDQSGSVARYADRAAQQVGDFATTLRQRSWNQLAGDVEDFGRRWPLVFIAAAVGVGFAAGRFLIASPVRSAEPAGARVSGTSGVVSGGVSGNAVSGSGTTASLENR